MDVVHERAAAIDISKRDAKVAVQGAGEAGARSKAHAGPERGPAGGAAHAVRPLAPDGGHPFL